MTTELYLLRVHFPPKSRIKAQAEKIINSKLFKVNNQSLWHIFYWSFYIIMGKELWWLSFLFVHIKNICQCYRRWYKAEHAFLNSSSLQTRRYVDRADCSDTLGTNMKIVIKQMIWKITCWYHLFTLTSCLGESKNPYDKK